MSGEWERFVIRVSGRTRTLGGYAVMGWITTGRPSIGSSW